MAKAKQARGMGVLLIPDLKTPVQMRRSPSMTDAIPDKISQNPLRDVALELRLAWSL